MLAELHAIAAQPPAQEPPVSRNRALKGRSKLPLVLWLALAIVAASATPVVAQIPSPEQFFGFRMGEDRKLARWDRLVEYYERLDRESDRIHVVNMGPSTMGNPFLVVFVSSPANLARLEELRTINARLSDPRGASEAELERGIADGKAVVVQSFGLHSSEVAASQAAAELIYEMATRTDEDITRMLDNTIAIMIPCFNPDGEILITDWYNQTVGTEYEAAGMPWLYHKYIGHDNNRDAFMQNTIESVYGGAILFRDWVPQAYIDHHQMGAWGARLYVPPYAEPIRPFGDPIVWREMAWYGAHIAYKEEEAGRQGVINAAIYSGWGHFGFHWITPFHNIAGMLTESASARLATPLYLQPDQLRGGARGLPEYEAQTTFPNPWPGGWWRVRDIVEQQKIAALAALDIAARNRETVLRNAVLKAQRQTERGASGSPVAYIVPAEQHDPLTAAKLVDKLLLQGVEVQRASSQFTHEGRVYGAGTWVVSMAQPKMGVIRWLLGRTFYPDNTYTRDREGRPIRPYDMSGDVMAEFMGVRVDPVETPVRTQLAVVTGAVMPQGAVSKGRFGYLVDGRQNDAFLAVNRLLDRNIAVRRIDRAANGFRAGDFVVPPSAPDELVASIAAESGVGFAALDADPAGSSRPVSRNRIGLLRRYYGGNMDEGWTRLLLERFGFPYDTLRDARIRAGNLNRSYDVIVLPADDLGRMTGEAYEREQNGQTAAEQVPPQYRSGFGKAGVDSLETFVRNGGTLVTFAEAGDLPLNGFGLPVRNVLDGLNSTEFWAPGSTLRVNVDNANPLAWGMPRDAFATFIAGGQVYEVVPSDNGERIDRIVTYIDRDILQSGWLLGEDAIANKAAMISIRHGQGRIVMVGFRPQHRMQTHGTFKLVFNALLGAGTTQVISDGGR